MCEGCWLDRAVIRLGSLRIDCRSIVLGWLVGVGVGVEVEVEVECVRFVLYKLWEPAFFDCWW